jgi:hypothetical protein
MLFSKVKEVLMRLLQQALEQLQSHIHLLMLPLKSNAVG